ncbi:MAG TPA: protein-disulfide reductase DsbD domain-containing protein [Chthonomonadales bacterium]|nr:protein-disulfide reductase DsbD domain-containing protein [Chthonomonadales bacterium]
MKYVTASAASVQAQPGKTFTLIVTLDIQSGYHIQANNAKDPYIPTRVELTAPRGFKVGTPVFPRSKKAEVAGELLDVFEGQIAVRIPITPPASAKGRYSLPVKVRYQACNDRSCFPPTDTSVNAEIVIGPAKKKAEGVEETPKVAEIQQATSTTTTTGSAPAIKTKLPGFSLVSGDYLSASATFPEKITPGQPFDLIVRLDIKRGYHIQSNRPAPDFIPTKVEVTAPADYRVGEPLFPPARTVQAAGAQIPVFEGIIEVKVPITPPSDATGTPDIRVKVSYQACDDKACFPPRQIEIAAYPGAVQLASTPTTSVTPSAGEVGNGMKGVPGYVMSKLEQFVPPEEFIRFLQTGSTNKDTGAGRLGELLGSGRLLLALPLIFLLGLALNLTPCVYPIIPITISYFGSQNHKGRKPVVLALFYVLGMAVMYSALGVAAGLTGGLFGSQLQNPWVLGVFALVMFALALSQFDRKDGRPIWEFQLPAALRNKASSRSGIAGAMLMGLMVGVVAAPCIGPAVVALLQWVGTQKNAMLGFITFFTLALGLGLPYIFLATASGSVKRLPRSGEWMIGVKHIFGVIMIWMGFYYLQTVLNGFRPGLGNIALVAATALGGLYLLFLDRAGASATRFFAFKRALGAGALVLAIWLAKPAPAEAIHWQPYSTHALEQARREAKKILIDFTAAWCAQCKELEHKTFSKKEVGQAASEFVTLRADMTNFNGPNEQKLKEQYGIVGLPTVVRLIPKEETVAWR